MIRTPAKLVISPSPVARGSHSDQAELAPLSERWQTSLPSQREPTVVAYLRDSQTLQSLISGLPAHRLQPVGVSNVEGLTEALRVQPPDIVLAEFSPSHSNGREARDLAAILQTVRAPVIAIIDEEQLQRSGYPSEMADFLTKPFRFAEAVVRIGKVLQQRSPQKDARAKMVAGDIELDQELYKVWIRGEEVHFSYKEFELLRYLLGNERKVVTRGDLLRDVWGYSFTGGQRTVDVHVRRLRNKLAMSAECVIETVVSVGYKFVRLAK